MDPSNQLVKSISTMITAMKVDMESKRKTDQEMLKVLVQGQQNESKRNDASSKLLE
jgi:hypothetical protein